MRPERLELEGVVRIHRAVHEDDRGSFSELFNVKVLKKEGIKFKPVQLNDVHSNGGVFRGLHIQRKRPQAKLVTVISGTIQDVMVDLRKGSETYGVATSVVMEEDHQLLVPAGYAHGFLSVGPSRVIYATDEYHDPELGVILAYDDESLKIDWVYEPLRPRLSEADRNGLTLGEVGAALYGEVG